jgi:type II secretory pathway pseudopilin PulG
MKGLTLLETMFALAVGAFVLIAVVIVYKSIRQSANVSQTMTDLNAIRAGYKSYLASGYKFDTTLSSEAQLQAVQDAGFLPDPLNTPWGQPYVVSLTKYSGYITIAIPGLNKVNQDNPSAGDGRCQAIWKAAQASGGLATEPATAGYDCAFNYRFP